MIVLTDDCFIAHALDGNVTAWDSCAAKLFGFSAEEVVGSPLSSLVPPDHGLEMERALERVRAGEVLTLETVRLHKDGTRIEVVVACYPARDEARRIVGVSTVVRDLDEVRRARAARAHLAAIIEGSDDAIVSKSLDGIIMSWNRSAERIFGYTAAEAIGQSILLIIPQERRAEETEVLSRIRKGEVVDHFETVRLRKDGTPVDISLTVSPVRDQSGRIVGASKIARDITQRKQIEHQRDQLYEQAERNNRTKDEFLAMLSHELRNPIGAISSALHVLGNADGNAEMAGRARAIIERQTRHLARIVDDLLDVARVMMGKIRVDARPMDLGEAVTSVVNALRIAGRTTQHTLTLDVASVWVQADVVRIEQIVGNLLDNALKYTGPGGTIRVTVAPEGHDAVLRVEDTGVGIAPALLQDVFELFVQGARRLDRSQGGLGIGLTLARRLVDLHGGVIEAASEGPERGSRFTVRLPAVLRPATLAPRPGEAAASPRRVLIVEDDADARAMLRSSLEWAGHEVFEAADGAEGIEAAVRLEPDVALIDLGLPEVDGYEVARQIRRRSAAHSMMLVAVTGYGRSEDQRRSAEAGFDLHCVKPVDPGKLAAILDCRPLARGLQEPES
jgi:two-component system CheB/CheR fusion protein